MIDLEWWVADAMQRPRKDSQRIHGNACAGLPFFINQTTGTNKDDKGNTIPFGTGAHSYESFWIWSKIVNPPNRILEIGFNLGHSAAVLLALFQSAEVVSVDIRDSSELHHNAGVLKHRYPDRHALIICDSAKIGGLGLEPFDAAFIDGAHDLDSILKDIAVCRALGVKDFLLDDCHPKYGDTLEAIRKSGLRLIAIVGGNMAICQDNHE